MNTNRGLWLAGLAALWLAGCATDPARSGAASAPRGSACVFESTISGFEPIDMTRLIIYGIGRDQAYLAEVSAGCFDLEYRWQLALVDGDHNGQICGFGRDQVAYRQGSRLEQCQILRLDRLTPERRKALEQERGRGQRKPELTAGET